MSTGKINVQAENIFPIIKKFLYSDHEIFLREIVSNAVDASSKLKTLARIGEFTGELGELMLEVKVDAKNGTLTVSDNGVGMTAEEVEKYLNQVAFSGAEEFLKKYEGQAEGAGIIGHFGLGFYSAFMVSKHVEVDTLSFREGAEAVKWSCDGTTEYNLDAGSRKTRGTDIIMHIADDSKEFLEEHRIKGILEKYCKFLPVKIKFGTKEESYDDPNGKTDKDGNPEQIKRTVDNIINNPEPLWTKNPVDLKDEDYKKFYRELYPMTFEEPLFHIHINVDYPFKLTGILYFPRLKDKFEMQKNKIQLYSNQVFITDSVNEIVPEYLTLLHGVIDSPDIPLNVSRSYLQSDGNVKKISSHITKKVADKLAEMFKNDREDFQKKWDDIKVFIEFGMLTDDKFMERIEKTYVFKNTNDEYATIEEYKNKIEPLQIDKDKKVVFLYTTNKEEQHAFIDTANNRGYDVIVMDSPLSSHMVGRFEQKIENATFTRVDGDTIDKLIKKTDAIESNLTEDQKNQLKPVIEGLMPKDKFTVVFESLSETDNPMLITQPEFMRRMTEMNQFGGMGMGSFPGFYNLVVNSNHPLISKILMETDAEKQSTLAKQATDLALLSQGMLKGEDLTKFIKRSVQLID